MELFEALLPSGRGVRYVKMTTKLFLGVQERVASRIGDSPDPGNARMATHLAREIVASCLKQITPSLLEWKETSPGEADVDTMLDGAAWIPVSYEQLIVNDGPTSLDVIFEELDDFTTMSELLQRASASRRGKAASLVSKVRKASIG